MDKTTGFGFLEVGINDNDEVVINHPKLNVDEDGVHIVFSPEQAGALASTLMQQAAEAKRSRDRKQAEAERKRAEAIPVDHSARVLTDGGPVTPDHKEIDSATGMQKAYVVLSPEERSKGFVRPVRRSYKHLSCGTVTTMGQALAETYARCPTFYSGTFCAGCRTHLPLDEFVWYGTTEKLGT